MSISQIEESDNDTNESDSISDFTSLINQGQSQIKSIDSQTNKLISISNKLTDCNKDEEKVLSQQIYEVNDNIVQSRTEMDKIIKTLKAILENSDEGENNEEEDKNKEKDETDLRIKKNLFDAMIKKYQNVINRYQNVETNIKSELKEDNEIFFYTETFAEGEPKYLINLIMPSDRTFFDQNYPQEHNKKYVICDFKVD